MRVWDCAPSELNSKHLVAEWKEVGQGLKALVHEIEGLPRTWYSGHPEVKRFLPRPYLIVARLDFIYAHAISQGYNFNPEWIDKGLPDGYSMHSMRKHIVMPPTHAIQWYAFRRMVDWPKSYGGVYWNPWWRDRMSKAEYIMLGKNWSTAYKNGARPDPDPYNISLRREHGN